MLKTKYLLFLWLNVAVTAAAFSQSRYLTYSDPGATIDSFAIRVLGLDTRETISPDQLYQYEQQAAIDMIYLGYYRDDSLHALPVFWIDGDTITFHLESEQDGSSTQLTRITGSPFQTDYAAFEAQKFTNPDLLFPPLYALLAKYRDSYASDQYLSTYIYAFQNDLEKDRAVYELFKDRPTPELDDYYMSALVDDIRQRVSQRPVALEKFSLYDTFQDFTPFTKIVKDSTQFIILDFWFLGCPPCLVEHQQMKKRLNAQQFDPHTQLIGISIDEREDFDAWKNYVIAEELPWDQYIEDQGIDDIYTETLGISTYPTYLLLDRSGRILARSVTFSRIIEELYWAQR